MKVLFRLLLLVASVAFAITALAQFKGASITLYNSGSEDKKVPNKYYVKDPVPAGGNITFKGTEFTLYFTVKWTTPLAKNTPADVMVFDSKGTWANGIGAKQFPKGIKEFTWRLNLTPGKYTIKLLNPETYEEYAVSTFTVVDKIGTRAVDGQKAGSAKLWVCQTVNDDWQPVGAGGSPETGVFNWKANTDFQILIKNNGKPFGANFLGIIIHKQGPDGKDTAFINEFQSDPLDDKSTMWCTVTGLPGMSGLPAGTYSIYVIPWEKRQASEHVGNFTEYYAKIKLIVK